jgi:hypothetical protein
MWEMKRIIWSKNPRGRNQLEDLDVAICADSIKTNLEEDLNL